LIEQDEDGAFVAEVPSLPGCISQGGTRDEALSNVREAVGLYLESLEAHGDPVEQREREDATDAGDGLQELEGLGVIGLGLPPKS